MMANIVPESDFVKLKALAAVIITGTATMPTIADLPMFDDFLRRAVTACGYSAGELSDMWNVLEGHPDWQTTKTSAANSPGQFKVASTLIQAAYFMDPEVLGRLGYPVERRHPADVEAFVAEYETGILDPVLARGAPG